MNTKFDFQRVLLLIKRRFALRKRDLIVSSLTMLGISTMILGATLFFGWSQNDFTPENIDDIFTEMVRNVFSTFVFISTSIFASQMFSEYGDKNQCIPALMLPATHFEKWLVSFLLSTVYFLAVVIGLFYLAEVLNILAFNTFRPIKIPMNLANGIFEPSQFWPMLKGFALVHSLFFFGSFYFNKGNQWWSTALAGLVIGIFIGAVQFQLPNLLWPTDTNLESQAGINYLTIKNDGIYLLPTQHFWETTIAIFTFLVPLILWFLSYLKMTEKEV
jgi:hypothetical protein